MDYTKGNGLTIAVGSNGTSKMWHRTVTNQRGEILEEFIICNYVCILKEATETPTVQHNRGSGRTDLSNSNSKLVGFVSDRVCGGEEDCSDRNIVNLKTATVNNGK